LDFHWYIEGCKGRRAFHSVDDFIRTGPHKYVDYMSIEDYVKAGRATDGDKTPLQVADMIEEYCDTSLSLLRQLGPRGDRELHETLQDIRTIAEMGKYYADKIRGATMLALHRKTKDSKLQRDAVNALTRAAEHWRAYTKLLTGRYRSPIWLNRIGHVDWRKLTREVERDIAVARGE
jgi:hypothetical protein